MKATYSASVTVTDFDAEPYKYPWAKRPMLAHIMRIDYWSDGRRRIELRGNYIKADGTVGKQSADVSLSAWADESEPEWIKRIADSLKPDLPAWKVER